MLIQLYTDYAIKAAVARRYRSNSIGDKIVYTVPIGSTGSDLWVYYMTLGRSITNNLDTSKTEEVVLDKDNYTIKPIKNKDGEIIKDKKGNIRYRIEIDNSSAFKNDTILFMELPNKNYIETDYTIEGNAVVLAKAYIGKERASAIFKSPALVLEVTGDFKLKYKAKGQDGKLSSIVFTYDYKNRNMTPKTEE